MLRELPAIHPEPSSTNVNELSLHASFKYIFSAMARACFSELDLSLGQKGTNNDIYFFVLFL